MDFTYVFLEYLLIVFTMVGVISICAPIVAILESGINKKIAICAVCIGIISLILAFSISAVITERTYDTQSVFVDSKSATYSDYKLQHLTVISENGTVYYTDSPEVYNSLQIGKTYNISASHAMFDEQMYRIEKLQGVAD